MEAEIIELLENTLKGTADFTAVMGDGDACRLFPGIAKEGTKTPFTVYRIDERENVSKDGAGTYDVIVALIFEPDKYKTCLAMKNTVKKALDPPFDFDAGTAGSPFSYNGSVTEYVEEMDRYVSTIGFTITSN